MSSSDSSKSGSKRSAEPQLALKALLDGGAAGDPLRRALWLDAVDQRLRTCLPLPLAAHVQLANVDRGRLVYLVDAAAWHAKLRMHERQLLDLARSLGLQVNTLIVRVERLTVAPNHTGQRQIVPMSASSRRALEAALALLTKDQPEDQQYSQTASGRQSRHRPSKHYPNQSSD